MKRVLDQFWTSVADDAPTLINTGFISRAYWEVVTEGSQLPAPNNEQKQNKLIYRKTRSNRTSVTQKLSII